MHSSKKKKARVRKRAPRTSVGRHEMEALTDAIRLSATQPDVAEPVVRRVRHVLRSHGQPAPANPYRLLEAWIAFRPVLEEMPYKPLTKPRGVSIDEAMNNINDGGESNPAQFSCDA